MSSSTQQNKLHTQSFNHIYIHTCITSRPCTKPHKDHFSNSFPHQPNTSQAKNTPHFHYPTLIHKNPALGYISTLIFPSNLKTEQENKGKLTLILSIGSKEALEPENSKFATLLLLDLGSDTVHPSPKCKTHKSRMEMKKKMKEIDRDW